MDHYSAINGHLSQYESEKLAALLKRCEGQADLVVAVEKVVGRIEGTGCYISEEDRDLLRGVLSKAGVDYRIVALEWLAREEAQSEFHSIPYSGSRGSGIVRAADIRYRRICKMLKEWDDEPVPKPFRLEGLARARAAIDQFWSENESKWHGMELGHARLHLLHLEVLEDLLDAGAFSAATYGHHRKSFGDSWANSGFITLYYNWLRSLPGWKVPVERLQRVVSAIKTMDRAAYPHKYAFEWGAGLVAMDKSDFALLCIESVERSDFSRNLWQIMSFPSQWTGGHEARQRALLSYYYKAHAGLHGIWLHWGRLRDAATDFSRVNGVGTAESILFASALAVRDWPFVLELGPVCLALGQSSKEIVPACLEAATFIHDAAESFTATFMETYNRRDERGFSVWQDEVVFPGDKNWPVDSTEPHIPLPYLALGTHPDRVRQTWKQHSSIEPQVLEIVEGWEKLGDWYDILGLNREHLDELRWNT